MININYIMTLMIEDDKAYSLIDKAYSLFIVVFVLLHLFHIMDYIIMLSVGSVNKIIYRINYVKNSK